VTSPRVSRRGLLIGGGAVLGWGLTAGCTTGSASSSIPPPTSAPTTVPAGDQLSGDLPFVALAAAVENLLATTYQSGLDIAADGKLRSVPISVTTWVKTAQSHHRDHAAAWNAILTAAGLPAVTGVDSTLDASVAQPAVASLKSVADLVQLAADLEQVAAATYLQAVQTTLTTTAALQTAIAIHPVEMQHVAVVNLFISGAPVPGSFASAAGARRVGDAVA
jgi:hypothetical protein